MMQLALAEADPGVVSWFTPEWLTALGTIAVAIATVLLILFSSKHEKEAIKEQKELVDQQKEQIKAQEKYYQLQQELVKSQQELTMATAAQNRFAAYVQIFTLLNDNGHRNARRRIVNLYTDKTDPDRWKTLELMNATRGEYNPNFVNSNYLESREIVKADFNQIGSMLKIGNIVEPEDVLKVYWLEILKCYRALQRYIDQDKKSMENFEYLRRLAEKYHQAHYHQVKSPLDMTEDEFNTLFRDVK